MGVIKSDLDIRDLLHCVLFLDHAFTLTAIIKMVTTPSGNNLE